MSIKKICRTVKLKLGQVNDKGRHKGGKTFAKFVASVSTFSLSSVSTELSNIKSDVTLCDLDSDVNDYQKEKRSQHQDQCCAGFFFLPQLVFFVGT